MGLKLGLGPHDHHRLDQDFYSRRHSHQYCHVHRDDYHSSESIQGRGEVCNIDPSVIILTIIFVFAKSG